MNRKKRGSALALVLVAVVVLLITGTGLLGLGMHGRMLAIRSAKEIAARTAADAGLTKAIFEMNQKLGDSSWDNSTLPQAMDEVLPGCDATFSYTVTGDTSSGFTIESTGNSYQAERKVNATLRLRSLFDSAIYAEDSIVLDHSSTVDTGGSYIATGSDGSGTLVLHEATVYGDIIDGYDMGLPEIDLPDEFDDWAGPLSPITDSMTLISSGVYSYIELLSGDKLTISGDVALYVPGDVAIKQISELEIQPGSSLILYLGGNFIARNGCLINNLTEEAIRCQIFGVGGDDQTFLFENDPYFYGVIYAPDADIYLKNSQHIYGAIVAENVELSNESALYYDQSLAEASVSDIGVKFVVQRWQEE